MVPALARAVAARGGRLLIVGGWVRDRLRGVESKDLDLELFGLDPETVDELLADFGSVGRVGRHFPVWRLQHQDLDIALPRVETEGLRAEDEASLDRAFQAAARHRDLSVNAMAWDPITERLLDPLGGRADLEARRLRAADPATFASDPLRGLRTARLCALLEAEVEPATRVLCGELQRKGLPVERIRGELQGLLLGPTRPSLGLRFLAETGLLAWLEPVEALRDVPQDPRWHPEGDVFEHTLRVVDRARTLGAALAERDREILQWAALAHDFGKPATTRREGERIHAHGHEAVGAELARDWLLELRCAKPVVTAVEALVAHHLAPSQLVRQGAGPRAYRRLARRLAAAGLDCVALERLARADHLGRLPIDAPAGPFEAGDRFLDAAEAARVRSGVPPDVVSAQRLIEVGIAPGPELGRALAHARRIQDEQGWQDPERIVARVVAELGTEPPAS